EEVSGEWSAVNGEPSTHHSLPTTHAAKPLAGIRVLDFGWILSVPHCTAWLGTLGAEVIKVESMARPDAARIAGTGGADGIQGPNRSAAFNGLNFSKKSITLNIATETGRQLALDLVRKSDVVCENFATGVLDRLGLGYEVLRAVKPDIVMLSGSTLGASGPEREATGWGPNVCAYAGLPFISGYTDGPPADLGGIWPDYGIGTMMVFALLSAVHYRNRTGRGQHVEVSMGEVVTSMIPEAVIEYTMNGRQRPRMGNRDPRMAPHDVYPCLGDDRWVAIAVDSDEAWRALCRTIGRDDLGADADFAAVEGRGRRADELDAIVADWTRRHTAYDVMHLLQGAGVAAGPVTTVLDLMEDPHFQQRGFVIELDHAEVGRRTAAGLPVHFSRMPELSYGPAPCIGEHNEDVFCGLLQLSKEELQRLQAAKIVY
ncbi:MAG: CaiB/BaiF CoA transferase family protein, partial [Dehalococcoidia bacterium]